MNLCQCFEWVSVVWSQNHLEQSCKVKTHTGMRVFQHFCQISILKINLSIPEHAKYIKVHHWELKVVIVGRWAQMHVITCFYMLFSMEFIQNLITWSTGHGICFVSIRAYMDQNFCIIHVWPNKQHVFSMCSPTHIHMKNNRVPEVIRPYKHAKSEIRKFKSFWVIAFTNSCWRTLGQIAILPLLLQCSKLIAWIWAKFCCHRFSVSMTTPTSAIFSCLKPVSII